MLSDGGLRIRLHDIQCNSSSFKSCILIQQWWVLGEKSHESFMRTSQIMGWMGLDDLLLKARESMRSSTVHATETLGTLNFMNRRIEWPSSTLHALSMRISFVHFIKIAQCRLAIQSKFKNCKFSQKLEGVRIWKFHNIFSGTHTFRPGAREVYSCEKRPNNWPHRLKGDHPHITKMHCCRVSGEAFPPKIAKIWPP